MRERVKETFGGEGYTGAWDIPSTINKETNAIEGPFFVDAFSPTGFYIRRSVSRQGRGISWWYLRIVYEGNWRPENEEEFKQMWLDIVRARCGEDET